MDHQHIFEVINISKSYSGRKVVKDISFNVKRGEIVGILGPNGAGKTTSFYIASGLIKPQKGKVIIDGADITKFPMYQRVRCGLGYLPQEASIFKGLTVSENIKLVLELSYSEDRVETMLDEILTDFSINHIKDLNAAKLSGGERRRVEIARCLASNPYYVMLDEPFAGIDPVAIDDIKKLVLALKKKNIGILITDHNVFEALKIIDRAYIIHNGSVIMDGDPKEIIRNKRVREVYLGEGF
jgi:lipopolysaccharide export system ATP-binding protein